MGLETGTYVNDLNTANPTSTDPKSQGDDHLRLIKSVLKNTFAGFPGLVVATGTEAQGATVNDYVVTVSPAPAAYTANFFLAFKATHTNTNAVTIAINALAAKALKGVDGAAVESGDIESGGIVVAWYDGTDFFLISGNDRAARAGDTYTGVHDFSNATQVALPANTSIGNVSSAELATLDGVTGGIQGQLDNITGALLPAKANLSGGNTFTGTQNMTAALANGSTAATQATGDNSTKVATTAFVVATAFNAALPGQAGNAGKFVTTDGLNAYWADVPQLPLTALSVI